MRAAPGTVVACLPPSLSLSRRRVLVEGQSSGAAAGPLAVACCDSGRTHTQCQAGKMSFKCNDSSGFVYRSVPVVGGDPSLACALRVRNNKYIRPSRASYIPTREAKMSGSNVMRTAGWCL
ncbi:hypothetical protein PLESTM_001058500 [Pleodorina starrii]|nr:hypothetical protein PLESTM_001058500 [Pleodorina starrii]